MKTKSSGYVLAVEILIVILFHAVKIKQSEKHPADMAISTVNKNTSLPKPVMENKTGTEYMLVNLVK